MAHQNTDDESGAGTTGGSNPDGDGSTVSRSPDSSLPFYREPSGQLGERPGDFIGPYKLLSILGEGGFGVVWLAERRELSAQQRGVGRTVKVEPALQLLLLIGNVGIEDFRRKKLSFGISATGIADGAGGATRDRNGMMTEQLKAPKAEKRHQIADVQTVRRRIEAAVKRDRPRSKALVQLRSVGAIIHQTPPLQFLVDIHRAGRLREWRTSRTSK